MSTLHTFNKTLFILFRRGREEIKEKEPPASDEDVDIYKQDREPKYVG